MNALHSALTKEGDGSLVQHRSDVARRRIAACQGEPLFLADWERAMFIHYEVDAAALRRDVPFELDLRDGKAYVSLVAFTLRKLRLGFGGKAGEWLCRPIGTHEFLNVRTYVRHRGEPGIFFLTEWLSNRLAVPLGPPLFGLPYRYGRIEYQHASEAKRLSGRVTAAEGALSYEGRLEAERPFDMCTDGSLDDFLMERYIALTSWAGKHRYFRVWHQPWRQKPARLAVLDTSLIAKRWLWFGGASCVGANYSPGVHDVWMGRPHRIRSLGAPPRSGVLSAFFQLP